MRAHPSHMGTDQTLNMAREDVIYWPGMHSELVEAVQRCSTYQETQPAQTKEPLMTHPLPNFSWQVVTTDCFQTAGHHYCIFVCVHSDNIGICELEDLTGKTLINKTKHVFATHGIPVTLISDNGPNYALHEFAEFARSWDVLHITSSLHHSQSNGRNEATVKTMKNVIRKAKGRDAWKAIREWRNTVTPGTDSSLVQRLMSRRTRSFMPCHTSLYKPHVQQDVTEQFIYKRCRAKKYYDRNAKSLPEPVTGQSIRAKDHHSYWKSGVVEAKVAPRSYLEEINSRSYRRNRVHIRDSLQNKTPVQAPEAPELVPGVITADKTQKTQLSAPAVQY